MVALVNLGTGALRLICAVVGILGIVLVLGATPGTATTDWPVSLVAPGAGLMAAGLAGLVALRSVQTWTEKQAEHAALATRDNRSRVYEQVLAHMISSFTGGAPKAQESLVRAMAASWASEETLKALGDWFRFAARYSREPVVPKHYAFELIYRVAAATRVDVDPEGKKPSKDDLLKMIFNDYDPSKHNSEADLSGIRVLQSGTVAGPPAS
jgi:hypothetical protein